MNELTVENYAEKMEELTEYLTDGRDSLVSDVRKVLDDVFAAEQFIENLVKDRESEDVDSEYENPENVDGFDGAPDDIIDNNYQVWEDFTRALEDRDADVEQLNKVRDLLGECYDILEGIYYR